MLLSMHIPKTAGVSFRKILAQLYGSGFVQYYWEITDAHGRVQREIPTGATCIHGHFMAHALADKFPEAKLVTWVRDPVDRVISSYFHRLREPDWRHPVCMELHAKKLSIVDYSRLELVRNEMTRFFGERQPEDFAFIGMFEQLELSMARFFDEFSLPPVPIPRENVNPERRTLHYEISPCEREQILEFKERDAELYASCMDRTRV